MCSASSAWKTLARRTRRAASVSLPALFLCGASFVLHGQEVTTPSTAPRPGFDITSISGHAVYYSTGLPEGSLQPTATPLPSDLGLGGSARLEWKSIGEKSRIMFSYTPSYTGRLRFAAWNALNHSASFNAARRFGRWDFGFSAGADLSNLSEFLFTPTVFASVAAVPVSFNELASAVLTGTYTNAQLASLLTGAPVVESPARNLFFGDRMFTSGAQASLAYAPQPRLSIKFTASASRSQHMSNSASGAAQSAYLIPRTSSAGANFDVSYARSARTQVGVSVGSSRVDSTIFDAYSTTAMASLGRKMGTRWFLQLAGGVGVINPVRSTLVVTTAPQPAGNASLGFHTQSHKFLGAYSRTVSDSYGIGANSTSAVSGTWRWARPGRSWWIESSGGWQQLAGSAYANTSGWRLQTSLGRAVGDRISLVTQYVYLHYSEQMATIPPLSQSAVRVSVVWNRDPLAVQ